jgi:xanthine dehydrogenase accessory factor
VALSIYELKVLVRGGGEMASGIAHRLHHCHTKVFVTEQPAPTTVRRTVAFAEAVYQGSQTVEGVRAVRISRPEEAHEAWAQSCIPLLVDPVAAAREVIQPQVVVDAIMDKRSAGTDLSYAPLVIGVGPGFTVGKNVHAIVESNRGHNLGRVFWNGRAEEYTGIPAPVSGYAEERVLRAPQRGIFHALHEIGDLVSPGDVVAEVDGLPIQARIKGMIRGLLRDGFVVEKEMKAGDIDPRGQREYCYLISDKARAIGGGVLEAILHSLEDIRHPSA